MRLLVAALGLLAAQYSVTVECSAVAAFVAPTAGTTRYCSDGSTRSLATNTLLQAASPGSDDCGCAGGASAAVVSGKPSDSARLKDPRAAISSGPILTLSGRSVTVDDVLGDAPSAGVSLVVLLRSFG